MNDNHAPASNVIPLPEPDHGPLAAPELLELLASEMDIDNVFVIVDRGNRRTYHSNIQDTNLMLRWLEEFKFKLLNGDLIEH